MIFEYFFSNLGFRLPWQPIKFTGLDKNNMFIRRLLKQYFCKPFDKISKVTAIAINANFNFSHYKSMAIASAIATRVLI